MNLLDWWDEIGDWWTHSYVADTLRFMFLLFAGVAFFCGCCVGYFANT